MANKKYTVDLSEDERAELESFVSHGKRSAQAITRARILLRADEGVNDPSAALSGRAGDQQRQLQPARDRTADTFPTAYRLWNGL